MKCFVLSTLTLLISTAASAATTTDLPGKWTVHSNIAGSENTQTCTFTVTDAVVGGTCSSDKGDLPIKGKIEAGKLTWQYASSYSGEPLTIIFTAPLGVGDGLTGTVDVQPMGVSGDFTAAKAK